MNCNRRSDIDGMQSAHQDWETPRRTMPREINDGDFETAETLVRAHRQPNAILAALEYRGLSHDQARKVMSGEHLKESVPPPSKEKKPAQTAAPALPAASGKGCPRCGGPVRTLNKPWMGFIAIPVMYYGGLFAIFAVGIVLALAVLLWPPSCPTCGRLSLGELPPKVRTKVIAKKCFVVLLLGLILFAAHESLTALTTLRLH